MNPRVSIVMPCYNAAKHLHRSIGSVQQQSFQNWELLAVDDGSTDTSWASLQQLAKQDPRIRPFHQPNLGAAAARNHGLERARGEYIAFLDADDTWHPQFLEKMTTALDAEPAAGLAYCGWQNIGLGGGRGAPFIPPDYETPRKIAILLQNCRWPIHGALTRSWIIQEAGGFDETLSSCMDFDLWLRIGVHHRLVRVPEVLAYYHHYEGNRITSDHTKIALNHFRVQLKFIQNNPNLVKALGTQVVRDLTLGELLRRGFDAYWKRDLLAARCIFRKVMKHGYGQLRDWKYMLPSLLPLAWHRWLIQQWEHARSLHI